MLALAYGAAHPGSAGPLVLVGCGSFDSASRARLQETLNERIDDQLKDRLMRLPQDFPDPSDRFAQMCRLTKPLYLYDPVTSGEEEPTEPFDVRAHEETWEDMLRLQEEGVYPAAFAAIESPVLMLHGAFDPHPGRMIRASLAPYLSQLEYREEDRWGHYPLLEKGLHDAFFGILSEWLSAHLRGGNQQHAA
jgi:pimeloyl-ACP methyl ester carboxylesterase